MRMRLVCQSFSRFACLRITNRAEFHEFHGDACFFSVAILARPPRSVWSHDRSNAKAVAGDDRKTIEKTVKPTNGFSRTSLKGKWRRLKGKAAVDREKGN